MKALLRPSANKKQHEFSGETCKYNHPQEKGRSLGASSGGGCHALGEGGGGGKESKSAEEAAWDGGTFFIIFLFISFPVREMRVSQG
jgi:hypothetical protein